MKLIIDIPEECYKAIEQTERMFPLHRNDKTLMNVVYNAIANAIPFDSVIKDIRPKGEWISDRAVTWKCSCCDYQVHRWNNTNFCPKCGADMRSG